MPPALAFGPHKIATTAPPAVLLAPMAGVTDAPFRAIVRQFGAVAAFSEMVVGRELVTGKADVRAKAALGAETGVTGVQLAGRDPAMLAEAARIAEDQGAPLIDLNFGCPAKKVTSGYAGSALMREPDLALSLIEAVVAATSVPVTVKMRLGWDQDEITAPAIAVRAEAAGVAMITVHGRTRQQFYKGAADWTAVGAVVRCVAIPVIVNGDIDSLDAATVALSRSGAAGVMIGRAAQARPWLPAEIAASIADRPFAPPALAEQGAQLMDHYRAMLAHYGVEIGLRVARKHLGWRLAAVPGGAALRAELVRLGEPAVVLERIERHFLTLAAASPEERVAA